MTLGTFTPRTRITGDKIDLRQQQWYNRPMLMRCNEYSDQFTSKMKGNAKVEAVWADVVDLASGTILINVLFTNGAIVDNLKEYAGTETTLPVKIVKQAGGQFGGYAVLEALTEQEQAAAGQWYQQYWGLVDQERAKREAASRPLQNQAPGGFNPAQGQQGFAPAAQTAPPQQFQQPAPQQSQFGQPTQFGGQVAQGGAPGGYNPPAQGQAPAPQGPPPGQYPAQQLPHDQGQFGQQQVAAGMGGSAEYGAPPQGQSAFTQLAQQPGSGFGAPVEQPYGGVMQGTPTAAALAGQGFGQMNNAPAAQAPGMFTDAPPPADPNQGFAAPNAQNMLAQLNNQLGS